MGENSGQIGTKDISKKYPVTSSLDSDGKHEGRQINLVPEKSNVSAKVQETL